ncbi:glycosyltransferase [Roseicyclus sp. F158]|uniref:Glycosyltransferase n=1 Tax=Tropicimonas omnivorans TaxID=3075590 RepID=A0ABU3DLD5_9RHOB|nr:glycosyltransferase [Roseicyclus sp. F158]MDT0684530.1 glycosyltransferase [Roseicyclus sp. F158]
MASLAPPPWIAYVVPFAFPEGGAGARRVLGNAQSLVAAGYDVTVISAQIDRSGSDARSFAPGIRLASIGERDAEHLPRALKRARYVFMGSKTRDWIAAQLVPPAAVILYSGYTPFLLQLSPLCRRRSIPLLFDAVEWYTANTALGFLTSPYLWNTELAMRALVPRLDGVIAISSYLATYYRGRGCPVVQVPPTLNVVGLVPRLDRANPCRRVQLAYCGSASNDMLDVVVGALMRLDPEGRRISLEIAGPTAQDVAALASLRGFKDMPAGLKLHGRVSHDAAIAITRAADFSIFLRQVNRVSKAGFPTKFVESLSMGTPVITNITSDLADHLRDGENGLACAGPGQRDVEAALTRALDLDTNRLTAMRHAARATAEVHFDYRTHGAALAGLLARCNALGPNLIGD